MRGWLKELRAARARRRADREELRRFVAELRSQGFSELTSTADGSDFEVVLRRGALLVRVGYWRSEPTIGLSADDADPKWFDIGVVGPFVQGRPLGLIAPADELDQLPPIKQEIDEILPQVDAIETALQRPGTQATLVSLQAERARMLFGDDFLGGTDTAGERSEDP